MTILTIVHNFGPFGTILTVLTIFFFVFFLLFFVFLFRNFSGRFDTTGSMIPHLVPEISPCDTFCDGRTGEEEEEQELGILGVRFFAR